MAETQRHSGPRWIKPECPTHGELPWFDGNHFAADQIAPEMARRIDDCRQCRAEAEEARRKALTPAEREAERAANAPAQARFAALFET